MSSDRVRKIGKQKRQSLSKEEIAFYSEKICKRLKALNEFKTADYIMIYSATENEVDLSYLYSPINASLHTKSFASTKEGKHFCMPKVISDTDMIALTPKEEVASIANILKPDKFGIKTLNDEYSIQIPKEKIDLIICPLTAYDDENNRVGMGRGYYDRFLADFEGTKIGVGFSCQRMDRGII
ncbi:MAG: 5-formyltetrahydrofolate cyclo-ligase, partial [Enterococcus sp.]|nr:5-formyltetrahydrofolate cyclo-ligase [Enterococcus sp.]